MVKVAASLVKELRERTGLGMMECKRALEDADGDWDKAEELLRVRSGAKAIKAATRIAAEGVVDVYIDDSSRLGAMVEVNCETDFVAKNADFLGFASLVAEQAARGDPGTVERLGELSIAGTTIEARRQALVQKIGENVSIRRLHRIQTEGRIASYVHSGKIGVLVEYEGDETAAKQVAMHIAFSKPAYLSRADIGADVLQRERGILEARARESGKSADIAARMVDGGLSKFVAEVTLLGQPFVMDDRTSVEKMLASRKTRLLSYAFFVVGEGLERRQEDFVEEVRKQTQHHH